MPRRTPIKEIQDEVVNTPSSPLRRSSRISQIYQNSPTPTKVQRRRSSASDAAAATNAKSLKTRRTSFTDQTVEEEIIPKRRTSTRKSSTSSSTTKESLTISPSSSIEEKKTTRGRKVSGSTSPTPSVEDENKDKRRSLRTKKEKKPDSVQDENIKPLKRGGLVSKEIVEEKTVEVTNKSDPEESNDLPVTPIKKKTDTTSYLKTDPNLSIINESITEDFLPHNEDVAADTSAQKPLLEVRIERLSGDKFNLKNKPIMEKIEEENVKNNQKDSELNTSDKENSLNQLNQSCEPMEVDDSIYQPQSILKNNDDDDDDKGNKSQIKEFNKSIELSIKTLENQEENLMLSDFADVIENELSKSKNDEENVAQSDIIEKMDTFLENSDKKDQKNNDNEEELVELNLVTETSENETDENTTPESMNKKSKDTSKTLTDKEEPRTIELNKEEKDVQDNATLSKDQEDEEEEIEAGDNEEDKNATQLDSSNEILSENLENTNELNQKETDNQEPTLITNCLKDTPTSDQIDESPKKIIDITKEVEDTMLEVSTKDDKKETGKDFKRPSIHRSFDSVEISFESEQDSNVFEETPTKTVEENSLTSAQSKVTQEVNPQKKSDDSKDETSETALEKSFETKKKNRKSLNKSKSNESYSEVKKGSAERKTTQEVNPDDSEDKTSEKALEKSFETKKKNRKSLNKSKSNESDSEVKKASVESKTTQEVNPDGSEDETSEKALEKSFEAKKKNRKSLNKSDSEVKKGSPSPTKSETIKQSPYSPKIKDFNFTAELNNLPSDEESNDSGDNLDKNIDKLISKINKVNEEDENDSDSDDEDSDYVLTMAEEGEEDTPSEDENEIIDDGESVGSNDSDRSVDNEEDENDDDDDNSFIDDESYELLSGTEYDLSLEKEKKSKIISLDKFDDETNVILIDKKPIKKKQIKKRKSRIIKQHNSSSEDENETIEKKDIVVDNNVIEEKEEKIEAVAVSTPNLNQDGKRKSSIIVHENISILDIQNKGFGDRINKVVDLFCSGIQKKGDISVNVSLDYAEKSSPDTPKNKDISVKETSLKETPQEPINTSIRKLKRKSSSKLNETPTDKTELSEQLDEPESKKKLKKKDGEKYGQKFSLSPGKVVQRMDDEIQKHNLSLPEFSLKKMKKKQKEIDADQGFGVSKMVVNTVKAAATPEKENLQNIPSLSPSVSMDDEIKENQLDKSSASDIKKKSKKNKNILHKENNEESPKLEKSINKPKEKLTPENETVKTKITTKKSKKNKSKTNEISSKNEKSSNSNKDEKTDEVKVVEHNKKLKKLRNKESIKETLDSVKRKASDEKQTKKAKTQLTVSEVSGKRKPEETPGLEKKKFKSDNSLADLLDKQLKKLLKAEKNKKKPRKHWQIKPSLPEIDGNWTVSSINLKPSTSNLNVKKFSTPLLVSKNEYETFKFSFKQ